MRKLVAGFIIGVLVASAADAVAQQRGRWVYGIGTESCGSWMEGRRQLTAYKAGGKFRDEDFMAYISHASWVFGFISGAGWDSAGDVTTRQTDTDGIAAALDKACADDPTRDISQAAMKVFIDLTKR